MNHLMNDETGPERPVPDDEGQLVGKLSQHRNSKEAALKRLLRIPSGTFIRAAKSAVRS